MQDRPSEEFRNPQASRQNFSPRPSHRPASDRNPEISHQQRATRLRSDPLISDPRPTQGNLETPGSQPMSASPQFPDNQQMHDNEPIFNHPPKPGFPQTNPYPPNDSYSTVNNPRDYPTTQGNHQTYGPPYEHRYQQTNYPPQAPDARVSATSIHQYTSPPYPPSGASQPNITTPPMENREKEVIIAVMGVTGTGKSYFIREVSGISDVKVSESLHSCTTKVQPYSFPYGNIKITLVDTPGFNDSTKSDTKILTDICDWMSSSYGEGKLLSGVIYLHRITDVRMDGTSLKNIKMFQRMCGPDAMKNVLLTTTQWSNVAQAQGERRERELQDGDIWAELLSQGASLKRFLGTRESGLGLIQKLIEKDPKPLLIQKEMAKGAGLLETEAGKFMNAELISLQKKHEKDLENLERERRNALEEKDDELAMILEQEQADAREKLEEAAAEVKLLADLNEDQMEKLEARRKLNEERERNDRAVIAIDLRDISAAASLTSMIKPYNTRGHLIYNLDDPKEFMKAPINITINYESGFISRIISCTKTIGGIFEAGTGNSIIYNGEIYQCKTYYFTERGSQRFVIFGKAFPGGVVGSQTGAVPHHEPSSSVWTH